MIVLGFLTPTVTAVYYHDPLIIEMEQKVQLVAEQRSMLRLGKAYFHAQ